MRPHMRPAYDPRRSNAPRWVDPPLRPNRSLVGARRPDDPWSSARHRLECIGDPAEHEGAGRLGPHGYGPETPDPMTEHLCSSRGDARADTPRMALQRRTEPAEDPLEQLSPYMNLFVYEYALRREAGLDAKEAVRWSFRRVLPPPDGLHPVLALIAGYKVESDQCEAQALAFLQNLIGSADHTWRSLQATQGWRPGTVGMGW